MCQYLKLSNYAPKQNHYVQLCSHLLGYHYVQNYAGIICQGLTGTLGCAQGVSSEPPDDGLTKIQ